MRNTRRTLKMKLDIVEEANRSGNIRAVARKYKYNPNIYAAGKAIGIAFRK